MADVRRDLSVLGDIPTRVQSLRQQYQVRDAHSQDVRAVRRGDFDAVAPDLFSEAWPRPIVANQIDVAARDFAASLAPMPSFNCSASSTLTEKARRFADKRTKIANNYVTSSRLEYQQLPAADQFGTYGMVTYSVTPDFDKKLPFIKVEESFNTYPVWDRYGCTVAVARVYYRTRAQLQADYGEEMGKEIDANRISPEKVEVIEYVDAKRIAIYCPQLRYNAVLVNAPNKLGRCYYVCKRRPGPDEQTRGAYDDVVWIQLARHRMQMLAMEAADIAVRSPLVVPPDVNDVPMGPGAIIHTQGGASSVGRARLDIPPQTFGVSEQLKEELQVGAMAPEARTGNIGNANITGQGVQELLGGWSSQIASAQTVFKEALAEVIELCFMVDELYWPREKKTVRGQDAGVPYEITYTPEQDIAGDHTVDIQYGMYAGLDPNRALVLTLQSQAAGLVSKDFARRQLPAGLNAADEEKKIEIEAMRDSLLQALSAMAQSIPQLVANGMDPSPIIHKVAAVTAALQKEKPLEEIVADLFAPPPAPPAQPGMPGQPGAPGDQGAAGFQSNGLPDGLQPGLATEGPQGRPDLQQFFAGLTAGGSPNLGSTVSRMAPAR
jgi:hypothetical protein